MPIQIPKLNIVKGFNGVKKTSQIPPEFKPVGQIPIMRLDDKINPQFAEIVKNISGIPTLEDTIKIEKLKKILSSLSIDKIRNIYNGALQLYIEKYPFMTKKTDKEYIAPDFVCMRNDLTEELQKNLKKDGFRLIALKQALLNEYPKCIASFDEWISCNLKIPAAQSSRTIFEHPYNKAIRLIGDFNRNDIEKSKKIEEKYKNRSLLEVIEEKVSTIEKMNKYFYGKNTDFYGQFNEKEYAKIKELALKYRVLNRIQQDNGFFTKQLESLLYSKPADWVCGNYIEGIGFITDEINVNGNDSVLTFQYEDGKYCLRIYEKALLESKNKFLSELPETIYLEELNELNKKANRIIQNEDNGLISEIRFTVMNEEMVKNYYKKKNAPQEYTKKILNGEKYAYLIENFKNFHKKDCPSGARIVAVKLLKLLKDKNAYPIFLTAQPYGSTHSPVSMYLNIGFKPLSRTLNEVYSSMTNFGEYKDEKPLEMYLTDFSGNSDRIDELASFYFNHS